MSEIFITSDLHLNHDREFIWGPRGFSSVHEMNQAIIERWNSVVGAEDEVYVLGDVMLGDNERGLHFLHQLKGCIHIICGNHDTTVRRRLYEDSYNVMEVVDARILKANRYNFFLCHYPVLCANYDDFQKPLNKTLISLCGHTHTNNAFSDWDKGLIYHVEMDAHNCTPIPIGKVIDDVRRRVRE